MKCQPGFTTELGAANKTQCFLIPYDIGINDEGEPYECGRDEFSPPGSDKESFLIPWFLIGWFCGPTVFRLFK